MSGAKIERYLMEKNSCIVDIKMAYATQLFSIVPTFLRDKTELRINISRTSSQTKQTKLRNQGIQRMATIRHNHSFHYPLRSDLKV